MNPVSVICTYQVKSGSEEEFEKLLKTHGPTLYKNELVTSDEFLIFRRKDKEGLSTYTEIFQWVDENASSEAHDVPEISAIWEPMGKLVEERNGLPKWNFQHCEQVRL